MSRQKKPTELALPPSALADPAVASVIASFGSLGKRERAFMEHMMLNELTVAEILDEIEVSPATFRLWLADNTFHAVYTAVAGAVSELHAVPAQQKRRWLTQAITGALALDTAAGYRAAVEAVKVLDELDNPSDEGFTFAGVGGTSSLKAQRHFARAARGGNMGIQINIGTSLRGEEPKVIDGKRVN